MADFSTTEPANTGSSGENAQGCGTGTGVGSGIVNKVRERATAELSSQKDRAFDGLGSVAQAVRQSTQQLRDQQHETIAGYVEQAADQIDRFARQLREKDVTELLDDAQRLARRQPAVFVGSAFALGLVGARFLKSSTRHHDDYQRRDEYNHFATSGSERFTGQAGVSSYSEPVLTPSSADTVSTADISGRGATGMGSASGIGSTSASSSGSSAASGTSAMNTTSGASGTGGSTRGRSGGKSESSQGAGAGSRSRRGSGSEHERS